ncbi:MAG: DsrE/DsrF/DrsH-like family protein [Candidatus Aminicenantia bacterium]
MDKENKLSMIVFSGDMDKILASFVIATGAVPSGMEVTMFFTFWGLQALKKRKKTGKGFFGKMLGFMLKDINKLNPSKMSFCGAGRWMFKKMMKSKNVPLPDELRKTALELGVKIVPCQMSMDVMEIRQEDLIEGVQPPVGVASFLEEASKSKITLFI